MNRRYDSWFARRAWPSALLGLAIALGCGRESAPEQPRRARPAGSESESSQGVQLKPLSGQTLVSRFDALFANPPEGDGFWDQLEILEEQALRNPDLRASPALARRCLHSVASGLVHLSDRTHRAAALFALEAIARAHAEFDHGAKLAAVREDPSVESSEVLRLHATYVHARLIRMSKEGTSRAMAIHDSLLGRFGPRAGDDQWTRDMRSYIKERADRERLICMLDVGLVREASRLIRRIDPSGTSSEAAVIAVMQGRFEAAREILEARLESDLPVKERAIDLLRYAEALAGGGDRLGAVDALERALESDALGAYSRMDARLQLAGLRLEADGPEEAQKELSELETSALTPLARLRYEVLTVRAHVGTERSLERMRTAFDSWTREWAESPLTSRGIEFLDRRKRANVLAQVLTAEIQRGGGPRVALGHLMAAQACATLARRMELQAPTVDELLDLLSKKDAGLVAFVPGVDQVVLLLADGSGVAHAFLSVGEIAAAEASLTSVATDRSIESRKTYARVTSKCTDALIPSSLRDRIAGWGSIRFVGLGRISAVPPDLLRLRGDWLGCVKPCAVWPSVVVGFDLENQRSISAKGAFALIAADHEKGALPFGESELAMLESELGGRSHVLLNGAARLSALPAERLDLLYVHCHGSLDISRPRPDTLALGDTIDATAVERTWAHGSAPRMVLLAACGAGREESRLGEDGAAGLVGAFLLGGSQAILAARRELYHVPTKDVAFAIIQARQEGHSVGEALLQARRELIDGGSDPRDVGVLSLFGSLD